MSPLGELGRCVSGQLLCFRSHSLLCPCVILPPLPSSTMSSAASVPTTELAAAVPAPAGIAKIKVSTRAQRRSGDGERRWAESARAPHAHTYLVAVATLSILGR